MPVDKRPSDLPGASPLTDDDTIVVNQRLAPGGPTRETRRSSIAALRALFGVDALEARIAALEAGGGGGTIAPRAALNGGGVMVLNGGGSLLLNG